MGKGSVSPRKDLRMWGFLFTVQSAVSHAYILPDFDLLTPFYKTAAPPKTAPKIHDPWLKIFSPVIYL